MQTLTPSLPSMGRALERPAASLTTRRPVARPVSTEPLGHVVEDDAPNGLVVARAVSMPEPIADDALAPEMPLRPLPKTKPPKRQPVAIEEAVENPPEEPDDVKEVVEPLDASAPVAESATPRPVVDAAPLPLAEPAVIEEEAEEAEVEPVAVDEPAPEVKPLARPVPTVDVAPPPPKPQSRAAEAPLPLPVSRLVTVDSPVDDLPPVAAPPEPEPALPSVPVAAAPAPVVVAPPVEPETEAEEPARDEPAPDEPPTLAAPRTTTTLGQGPTLAPPPVDASEEPAGPPPAPLAAPAPAPAAPARPTVARQVEGEPPTADAAEPEPEELTPAPERPGPLASLTRGMRDLVAQRFTTDAPEPVVEGAEPAPPLASVPAGPEARAELEPELDEGEDEAPDEPVRPAAAAAAPAAAATEPAPRPTPVQRLEREPTLTTRPLPLVVARQVTQPEPRPAPPVEVVRRVEAATGVPLQRVTVNRDASATRTTEAHQARAVTFGDTVHMNPDEGSLDEPQGRGLVAHELVHAAQQQILGAPPEQDSEEGRQLEASAQAAEAAETAGRTLPAMPLAAPSVPSPREAGPGPSPLPLAPIAQAAPDVDAIVNQVVESAPPGTVQRTAAGGIEVVTPTAVEPPPSVATPPSAPAAAAPATVQRLAEPPSEPTSTNADGDLDEQARRLYPRLRSMLAADLRLERERAGRLSDVRY